MRRVAGFILVMLCAGLARAEAPAILASVRPLQLLAIAVTGDVDAVGLLVEPNQSHHEYQLRPSDRQRLEEARIVFWIGPRLETFLVQPLSAAADGSQVVSLDMGAAVSHGHAHGSGDIDSHHHHHDAHIWLDPEKAMVMARRMAQIIVDADPTRREQVTRHLARLQRELAAADRDIMSALNGFRPRRPYLVLHDAYSHFEQHYGLERAATYANTPEQPPGARHLLEIRRQLQAGAIRCVLLEPQHRPKALISLLQGLDVRTVELDLMAAGSPSTPAGFVSFYRKFGRAFVDCLQP